MIRVTFEHAQQPHAISLSEGLLWRHPLESQFGAARRLLSANTGAALHSVKQALVIHYGADRRLFSCFSGYGRYPIKSTLEHPSDLSRSLDALTTIVPWNGVRQCPQCAQHLFHPSVYQLQALPRCPIHRCAFTVHCPDCGHPWGRPLTIRRPNCKTCGCLDRPRWGRTRLRQKHYRALGWLTRWLNHRESRRVAHHHPTLFDTQKLTDPKCDIEKPRFRGPEPSSPYYIAFESQRIGGIHQNRLSRLGVITEQKPLKSRSSSLHPWHPVCFVPDDYMELESKKAARALSRDSPLVMLLCLALRRILRWQQDALGFTHRLVWSDLRAIRPEAVREGMPPCPLCMAFSFWCRAITLKFTSERFGGSPREHELCRFAHYTHYPNIPEGVFIRDKAGRHFRPSPNFERWLFLRASDYAFLEFVQFALYLFRETADTNIKFKPTGYPNTRRFSYSNELCQLLEISQKDDRLDALYWPGSALDQIVLTQNTIQKIEHCQMVGGANDGSFIWDINPDPKKLLPHLSKQLLLLPTCHPCLGRLLYPWRSETPMLKPYGPAPYDLRVVIGETKFATPIDHHGSS